MEELRNKFRLSYTQMRDCEQAASRLRAGDEEHYSLMLEVFEAEDALFHLATLMLALKESESR